MVQIAICNEDNKMLNQLKDIMQKEEPQWQFELFESGAALEEKIQKKHFAVYFLDIELKNADGYILASKVRKADPTAMIVFVSSDEKYDRVVYEVDVIRFLTKPIEERQVIEAVKQIKKMLAVKNFLFSYRVKGMSYQVKLSDIIYFERKRGSVQIHMVNGDNVNTYTSIRGVEKIVKDKNFGRCHPRVLINFDYVKTFRESMVTLENEDMLLLTPHYKDTFREQYTKYCWNLQADVCV